MLHTLSKKRALIIGIASFLLCFSLVYYFSIYTSAESQFDRTRADIENRIDNSLQFEGQYMVNGMPLGLSSNPYDYVKDNENFDALTAYGENTIDDLIDMMNNTDKYGSFDRYLMAIAIETITKTDMKKFDEYSWDEADKFIEQWSKFTTDANAKVKDVINNKNLSEEEKWKEVAKYGTLSIPALQETDSKLSKKMIDMITTSDRESVVKTAIGEVIIP